MSTASTTTTSAVSIKDQSKRLVLDWGVMDWLSICMSLGILALSVFGIYCLITAVPTWAIVATAAGFGLWTLGSLVQFVREWEFPQARLVAGVRAVAVVIVTVIGALGTAQHPALGIALLWAVVGYLLCHRWCGGEATVRLEVAQKEEFKKRRANNGS